MSSPRVVGGGAIPLPGLRSRRTSSSKSSKRHLGSRQYRATKRGLEGEDPSYLQSIYLKQDVEQGTTREGWDQVESISARVDRDQIKATKEDMDTLLVFAGLFSAVLTAFNIESYRNLQQDQSDVAAKLLFSLLQSVHSFTIQGNFINSTSPLPVSPSFTAPRSAILVNTLWFVSLVFSLVTAALAISVKQWLRQFPPDECQWSRAQDRMRVRNFRHRGLILWGVMDVAAALPVFIQISLVLFLLGLSEFTRKLNDTVGWITTGLIFLWFSILLVSTLAPIFSARCPYKTPLLQGPLSVVREWIIPVVNRVKKWINEECEPYPPNEEQVVADDAQDIEILKAFDNVFRNRAFLDAVKSCLSESPLDDVLAWVRGMLANRSEGSLDTMEGEPGVGTVSGEGSDEVHDQVNFDTRELDEFSLYPLTKPALRLTVQTIFNGAQREFGYYRRYDRDSLDRGLPENLKVALTSILRVALYVPELVGPPARFGTFLTELLSWDSVGLKLRKDLISGVLSRDWFMPYTDAWITEPRLVSSIIDVAIDIFPSTEPESLACAILNLALHTRDDILEEYQPNFTNLFTLLSPPISHLIDQGEIPRAKVSCAKTCLHLCELLNDRIPVSQPGKFVGQALLSSLRKITTAKATSSTPP